MAIALGCLQDVGIGLADSEKLCDSGYADGFLCLFRCTELERAVAPYDVCFAPLKCQVLLRDWASMFLIFASNAVTGC